MGLEMILSHTFKIIGINEKVVSEIIDQAGNG